MKLKQKLSRGIAYLITTSLLCSIGWAKEKQNKGTLEMAEKYVPKVIIEAKWEKVKEELVPHEWEPLRPWISCIPTIKGEFRSKEVSFGYYNSHTDPPIMPRSITLDYQENLYILDPCNFRVLKFNKDGKYLGSIDIKRIKPKKGYLSPFEIIDGVDIGADDKINVNKDGSISIYSRDSYFNIKELKFSKTGRFMGTEIYKEEKDKFTLKIQSSNRGIFRLEDKKKGIKKELFVELTSNIAKEGYELWEVKFLKEDKEGNIYLKIVANKEIQKEPYKSKDIEQIYTYNSQGKLIYISKEREIFNEVLQQTTAITDDGVIYELVIFGEKEKARKEKIYKLDSSDKRIRDIEHIEDFLKEVEECGNKEKKITLDVLECGKWYETLKVIKWEKK